MQSSNGFRLYDEALKMVRMMRPHWEAIGVHDRDMMRQLRKAACAVPPNVQEGRVRWNGHGKNRLETAMQSARECIGHLDTAEAAGFRTVEAIEAAKDQADKVAAMTWKCLHRRRR